VLLHEFLEASARKYPNKVALVQKEERWTYRAIDEKANQVAHLLRNQGIQRGDRVAIFLDNSVEAVISLFGILKADAVFLMLSSLLKPAKLGYILNNCSVKMMISEDRKLNAASEVFPSIPSLKSVISIGMEAPFSLEVPFQVLPWSEIDTLSPDSRSKLSTRNIDLDLATIIYTSGSTGNPKGVMLTHLNMISAATSITTYLRNVPEDIIIDCLPLSFDYGLYQVLMTFKFGGTIILEKSFTYPYDIIKKMVKERVTGFPGVPTIFAILLQMEDLKRFDLGCLRYVTNTAAALPVDHIQRLRKIFPQAELFSMYGLTECKRVSYLPPEELDRRPGSVGRGMPNEEVWIVGDKGNRVDPGVVGELVIRGSNVMRGYWGDPEATDRVLRPGVFPGEKVLYTGDLFRMDEEGFLYFVGRKDDMIKTRGERVSPKEIEQCLCSLDGIAEAAAIGVPDDILGQAIKIFISSKDGLSLNEQDVLRHCKKNLEDFMVPKYIHFLKSLPKNANGKIDKQALKGIR
jgi:acyl-CoA ligase (AMP-forming) (exosortase A-associated)